MANIQGGTDKTRGYLAPLPRYVAESHHASVSTFTLALRLQVLQDNTTEPTKVGALL